MRVIAGTYGGRRLVAVPGAGTRPTADRVREALFSRLQSRYSIVGISVLDLFAGTGALGIEAISRGAGRLVSVERSRQAARVLIENLRSLGLEGRAQLVVRDVGEVNPVRVVDVFVEGLDLRAMGFAGIGPAKTGRPAYHPAVLLKRYI